MDHARPLFRLFSFFLNKQYNFYDKHMWKISILCPLLGFEPKTSRTRVFSHNHYTRTPTQGTQLSYASNLKQNLVFIDDRIRTVIPTIMYWEITIWSPQLHRSLYLIFKQSSKTVPTTNYAERALIKCYITYL